MANEKRRACFGRVIRSGSCKQNFEVADVDLIRTDARTSVRLSINQGECPKKRTSPDSRIDPPKKEKDLPYQGRTLARCHTRTTYKYASPTLKEFATSTYLNLVHVPSSASCSTSKQCPNRKQLARMASSFLLSYCSTTTTTTS